MSFYKSYDQQFNSSITENPYKRAVFNDLCLLADRNGIVDRGPYEAIAAITRWPVSVIVEQMAALQQPDPHSRSSKLEGRRIVQEGVNRWRIVNYIEFRNRRDSPDRRTQVRDAKRRQRAREKESLSAKNDDGHQNDDNDDMSSQVITGHHRSSQGHQQSASTPGECQPVVIHGHPKSAHAEAYKSTPLPPTGGNGGQAPQTPQAKRPYTSRLPFQEKKIRATALIDDDGWSAELRAAARLEYPRATLPSKFEDMPTDIQRAICVRWKKMRAPA